MKIAAWLVVVTILSVSVAMANTPMPPIRNSPDTECEAGRQCTEAEFGRELAALQRKWSAIPEEIRAACAANRTLPSIHGCILRQTLAYLNAHPNERAHWLP